MDKENNTTDLSKHKRDGSKLIPPFLQIKNMQLTSFKDNRLPELLWAGLLINCLERKKALDVFRSVAKFVEGKEELYDVTLSGIATWPKEVRKNFISEVFSEKPIKEALKPLLIFPELPAIKEWSLIGSINNYEQELNKLAKTIVSMLWHQSQEATDCRWVWVLCAMVSGKMKAPIETVKNIFYYPNRGDMKEVRPTIRASEMTMEMIYNPLLAQRDWPKKFWLHCHKNTMCIPLPTDNYIEEVDEKKFNKNIKELKYELLKHFAMTENGSHLDHKHSVIFGYIFYALRIVSELTVTNLWKGAVSRPLLRSVVEIYITLAYLIKNDKPELWRSFMEYGSGKAKQCYLKIREFSGIPSFIDIEKIKQIANEDRWEELVSIELGHWDKADLRKMSEEADCKEIYDKYYDWTSAYAHGNWGAIRESVIDICSNPLHRLHKLPAMAVHPLPSTAQDFIFIINKIMDLINIQYPGITKKLELVLIKDTELGK